MLQSEGSVSDECHFSFEKASQTFHTFHQDHLVLPLDILVKMRHILYEKCEKSDCPVWVKTWLLQLICSIFWDAGWCLILGGPWTVCLHPLLGSILPQKTKALQLISFCEGGGDPSANRKNLGNQTAKDWRTMELVLLGSFSGPDQQWILKSFQGTLPKAKTCFYQRTEFCILTRRLGQSTIKL